jgi:hypothetical protein
MAAPILHYPDLPAELRVMVRREHLVLRRQPITPRMRNFIYGPLLGVLASVNREMHQLAVETYYR